LDGYDNVSFGEFQVFVLDPLHKLLEKIVQQQLSERFIRYGRAFRVDFHAIFWDEMKVSNSVRLRVRVRVRAKLK
jgi:hypothetical protein